MTEKTYVFQDYDDNGTFFNTGASIPNNTERWYGPFSTRAEAENVASVATSAYRAGSDDKLAAIRNLLGCARK
jgi:hypothetical protein